MDGEEQKIEDPAATLMELLKSYWAFVPVVAPFLSRRVAVPELDPLSVMCGK
jgi:hypothetical protein